MKNNKNHPEKQDIQLLKLEINGKLCIVVFNVMWVILMGVN